MRQATEPKELKELFKKKKKKKKKKYEFQIPIMLSLPNKLLQFDDLIIVYDLIVND